MEQREIAIERYGGSTFRRKFFRHGDGRVEKVDVSEKWTTVSQFFRVRTYPLVFYVAKSACHFKYISTFLDDIK